MNSIKQNRRNISILFSDKIDGAFYITKFVHVFYMLRTTEK